MIKIIQDEQKDTQKHIFQKTIENQPKYYENWSGFLDELWFKVRVNKVTRYIVVELRSTRDIENYLN